jgi:putative aldouronate transport system permease protein
MRKKAMNPHDISTGSNLVVNIILIVLSLVCIIPLVIVLSVSFSDEKTLLSFGYNILPQKLSLGAYDFIFSTAGTQLLRSYMVTLFVTVIGTVASMFIISMYSYVISRRDFKYRNFFSFFIFLTMLFNGGLVSNYLVVVNVLHLKDTLWALILPYIVNPWWVLILRTYISSNVPDSIIESARIDGAGELRIFFRIVFPLAMPGIATIALFCILQFWNDWWLALLYINDPNLTPVSFLLYKIQTQIQFLLQNTSTITGGIASDVLAKMPSEGARMAMVILGVGPIILVFPFIQKYLVKGLTVGSIKG